jgi:hypothetical protein
VNRPLLLCGLFLFLSAVAQAGTVAVTADRLYRMGVERLLSPVAR